MEDDELEGQEIENTVEEDEENGEEEEGEEEGEEDEEGAEEEGEPEPSSELEDADDHAAAPVILPEGEGPASRRLKEALADPEVSELLRAAMAEEVQRSLQVYGVTQAAFQTAASQHPEIFAKYGGKIQMMLSMMPEKDRHTRKSVDIATLIATTEHKAGTPEFASELLKVAQKLTGKAATAQPKPPKAPIPAASRPPSSSSAGRAMPASVRDTRIKSIMAEFGLDREEAEAMQYDLKRKPIRR